MNNEVKEKQKEFTFIFINGGWWLKISTVAELADYLSETDSRWENALNNLLNSKEFTKFGNEHAGALATSIGLFGVNHGINGIDATLVFKEQIVNDQLNELKSGNTLAINKMGGYWVLKPEEVNGENKAYSQWCRKREMVFPNFTKRELKIKKFPLGNHWYAYLGDVQLRDNDKVKWNTYEDAYEYAKQFISDDK